ncbi:replication initiation protein [Aliihoeflea sp. 2WW]|uniref:replication initiation protein n=1 Tax=Aliihoeflea sp. 2WW TaxID=1381123 RepID=UPI00046572F1|nr:replication initiation protein [Aliihoeflea sp. 2WW]
MSEVRKSKTKITGADRKGVQASDLIRQLTDAYSQEPAPTSDKPRVLIETLRIVGEDILTAQDAALYELMLANARNKGIDLDKHTLQMPDVLSFLRVRHTDRVLDSLERLTRTVVRYDIATSETRRRAPISMISAEFVDDLKTGTSILSYEIPRSVREIFFAARQYTMLEIAAFARFSSRYAGRLYQRLALRAGMDGEHGKVWEIEPKELAEQLGYPTSDDGGLHLGSFMRRCVEPAVADVQQHVERFSFEMDVIRGASRGRPIDKLVFRISGVQKPISQMQAAHLSSVEMRVVRSDEPTLDPGDLPSTLVVGRAVTATGVGAVTLSNEWRAFIAAAKEDPFGSVDGNIQNCNVIAKLRSTGVGHAFMDWVDQKYLSSVPPKQPPAPTTAVKPQPRKTPPPPAFMVKTPTPVPVTKAPAVPVTVEEPAAAIEPPVIRRKTEAEKLEESKRLGQKFAQNVLDYADGYYPGREFECWPNAALQIMQSYADFEAPPFDSLSRHINEKTFKDLVVPAVAAIQKMEDAQFKKTMVNICIAVRDWDIPKFLRICKAIKLTNPMSAVRAAPLQRQPSSTKSQNATRQVTETSAEYDFADPAYSSLASGFEGAYESESIFAD